MADISSYERQYNGKQGQKDSGEPNKGFGDGASKFGKKNFKGPQKSKSGAGVSPHASGSPWKYGRSDQAEASYEKDYSRKGSDYGSGATGPKSPSAEIPDVIFGKAGPGKASRGQQKTDHI